MLLYRISIDLKAILIFHVFTFVVSTHKAECRFCIFFLAVVANVRVIWVLKLTPPPPPIGNCWHTNNNTEYSSNKNTWTKKKSDSKLFVCILFIFGLVWFWKYIILFNYQPHSFQYWMKCFSKKRKRKTTTGKICKNLFHRHTKLMDSCKKKEEKKRERVVWLNQNWMFSIFYFDQKCKADVSFLLVHAIK